MALQFFSGEVLALQLVYGDFFNFQLLSGNSLAFHLVYGGDLACLNTSIKSKWTQLTYRPPLLLRGILEVLQLD